MATLNRFVGAVKRGVSGVQSAYVREKAAAETRAKTRMENARTAYEKEKVRAKLRQETAELKTEMYVAKAAATHAEQRARDARLEAGEYTFAERLMRGARSAAKGTQSAMRGAQSMSRELSKASGGGEGRKRVVRRAPVHRVVRRK